VRADTYDTSTMSIIAACSDGTGKFSDCDSAEAMTGGIVRSMLRPLVNCCHICIQNDSDGSETVVLLLVVVVLVVLVVLLLLLLETSRAVTN